MEALETECYCGKVEEDEKPYMLVCAGCKKHFHAGCLDTAKLSPLEGDIFYSFNCRQCGDEGTEDFDRMKLQWLQVVILTLYNLQLKGSGKCGFFRWKEHICAFIDKHWTVLFANYRHKTSLWHGTVAGTLSSWCPTYFVSGSTTLGESGWWKLAEMKPPMLKLDSARLVRKKAPEPAYAQRSSLTKVEGRRSRRGKSSIEAAIALKIKRSTLMEAKDIRKAKAEMKASDPSTPPADMAPSSSSLPDVETFSLFQAGTTNYSNKSKLRGKSVQVKQEPVDTSYEEANNQMVSTVNIKEEPMDSENSIASASASCSQTIEADDSNKVFQSFSGLFAGKSEMSTDAVENLFLQDSDSDLEIDPGSISPSAGLSSGSFRESPSLQDILSSIDDNSKLSEDLSIKHEVSGTVQSEQGEHSESPSESEEEQADSDVSDTEEIKRRRKRKLEEPKQEEPPPPKFTLLSMYDEVQLLQKLNLAADKTTLDPELRRLRRKLIVRQLHRERGRPVFDIDQEVMRLKRSEYGLVHDQEGGGQNQYTYMKASRTQTDGRILDRYQCNHLRSQASLQHFPSFLNRLVGTADNQLQSITSPYTTRVLKPFILRDRETKPVKMKLLEEIVAYPHRSDSSWVAPPSASIDYCYVRPQHIPSVNTLCREFFWPGVDLSECLQYPDFSCVVLYRKVVIGFAFMVPDVKYNEAYISFIFTHPEWRRAGIARFMLYHLIQTCMGKDVTLHVSATNTAMLLYQSFGFKVEELILDFYDKYYPPHSRECKHAFFLRLRR